MRTFEIYVHNDCENPEKEKYSKHAQAIMICNAISDMREKRRAELNLKGPRAKYKEETMNPEKEASKCQQESFAEQARRIAKEEIDKALKDFKWRVEESLPQLTQKENNILKGLHYLGWSWIKRNVYKELIVMKNKNGGIESYYLISEHPNASDEDFQFITWQDEPMLIAKLIDWGDEA